MCGICGRVDHAGGAAGAVQQMNDALRHRGPDDHGLYSAGDVALAQRRLAIIDLSGGRQPMSNEDGTIWIVFNGEIYNYRELRAGLRERHQFATSSDTEVLLHLYEERGADCVRELRGMFAFAIWDGRDSSLLLARDHLGQKPLFYSLRDGVLSFASEIKALLAADPSLRELDFAAFHQYLTLRLIAPPHTMYRGVSKLPPAHTLRYKAGAITIERYWSPQYEPKYRLSEADLLDQLEQEMLASVRYHMVSDVPVGAFLSGGLDSSLVVAMMARVAGQPVKTFSMGVPYEDYSELPYARMVAERYGTEHYEETVVPSLIESLPDLVYHLDEPSDPLSVCMYAIAQMARREVKVVLGGDGGDELFGGYDRYYGNRYVDYYAALPAGLRRRVLGPALGAMPDGFWYKSLSHRLKWMHRLSFLEGGDRYAQSLSYFYFTEDYREALYSDLLRREIGDFDAQEVIRRMYAGEGAAHPIDRMLLADSMVRLPDHPVMILDRTTMAHGLEARAPLMDHVLVEFAARLPAQLKVRGRTLRYIQTRLAERYLPPALLRRKKQGFSSALPYLLAPQFRRLYQAFLTESHLVRDGYLRAEPIGRLLAEHLARKADHGNRLWLLCNSEIWYRMGIERWSGAQIRAQLEERSPAQVTADAYA